ncbi:redoxin domain-containing protein [bacterium]|nr:redoxin domain-containing protein [bacterium]
MKSASIAIVLLLGVGLTCSARAQDAGAAAVPLPHQLLSRFVDGWDETLWQQSRGGVGYMRADDDRGWQLRMQTLQQLVRYREEGQQAVKVLLKSLKSESTPERILAAQALGYLSPWVPAEPLIEAAKSDADPAVRLYAVDALGMTGRDGKTVDWKSLQEAETNRDVRRHIDYAIERDGTRLDQVVVRQLIEWNSKTMNSAKLGQSAPDFTLTAATGEIVKLSDFKGKKAVVLVFIYGDT